VRPAAGAAPTPTNGTPPDGCPSGMRWGDYGGDVWGGDKFSLSPSCRADYEGAVGGICP
jgi:hypothetical protein